jgi:hypothetical protein
LSPLRAASLSFVAVLTAACGLAEQPTVNTAELLVETQEVVVGLRDELAAFQDQIDSLRVELTRQDSLLRSLANLQGMPMPPKPLSTLPPQ